MTIKMADGSQSLIPRIYVAPISPNVTQNHIREIMGHFGNIDTVDFSSMQTDKVVVGIANIVYDSQESVQSAIKHMDKGEIDGMRIRVTLSEPTVNDLPTMKF